MDFPRGKPYPLLQCTIHEQARNSAVGPHVQAVQVGGKLYAAFASTDRPAPFTFAPDSYIDISSLSSPDINVPQSKLEVVEPERLRRERDLRGALDKDNGEAAGDKPAANATDKAREDYQLTRALDLIRALTLFKDMVSPANG